MQTTTRKPWSKAVAQPAKEFPLTPLPVLAGKIPETLRGSLYRNGPGRLERGGERVGHWFDGDGAVLAVHFTDTGATATYRYVQTKGYQKEAAANQFLYPNYGMTAPGPFWNNWLKDLKNAANTSVLPLPDKLLTLWEGGKPHALDLENLKTWGVETLSGLEEKETFSAHPKVDPDTGEFYNFGISAGLNATLTLYHHDPKGKILNKSSTTLEGFPLIHDFVMAGQYLVFFVPPAQVNLLSAGLGLKSYSDSIEWKLDQGTEVLIFDRQSLSLISRSSTEAWFQWHYTNGYVDEAGTIIVEIVRYEDFYQTNQYLKEVARGKTETPAKGLLWQIKIEPQTGKVIETTKLLDIACDFPVVSPQEVGKPWHTTYLSVHPTRADISQEIFRAIAAYNQKTGNLTIANMGENCYPSEPIYVPTTETEGLILTVVYDGNQDTSEVRIYQSDRLESEPICRLSLPNVIPPSFHGKWQTVSH